MPTRASGSSKALSFDLCFSLKASAAADCPGNKTVKV